MKPQRQNPNPLARQPLEVGGDARPLPARGRVVARYAGRAASALLELPSAATRERCGELPAAVWLTVGLLAADGMALQVSPKNPRNYR